MFNYVLYATPAGIVWCYDAAVGMKKKQMKKGYVLKWRGRASMSNKLWKSGNKKMAVRWKTCLRNMPAELYEKLFPDVYNWVKKFATKTNRVKSATNIMKKNMLKKKVGLAKVKMWQVCRRMKFSGALQDFSMWACLFGDPAFTKVTVGELKDLVPFMNTEMQQFRHKHKWWPHPAVLMHIAREARKRHLQQVKKHMACQKEEMTTTKKMLHAGAKKTKRKMTGHRLSGHRHVFWHEQSHCWRALVKKTRDGRRHLEHFEKLKDAVQAVSDGLGIPVCELKKVQQGGNKKQLKMASLYDGVFYDSRKAYKKKWMAVIYVKKSYLPTWHEKVWLSLGHFDTMLGAAKAVAKAGKKAVTEIRKSKKAIYNTQTGKDLAEQRFVILCDVFVNNYVGKKHVPANPPDYEKSEMLMKCPAHRKMFREEPVMEEASIGLKYGPPRDDLLRAWKKTRRSAKYWETLATNLGVPKNVTLQHMARKLRIMVTLQQVAKMLHKKDCSLWVKNAGRFVSKNLGPVMFLRKNRLVQKVVKKK